MNRMRKMISFESKFPTTSWPNSTQSLSSGSKPPNANIWYSIPHGVVHLFLCSTLVTKRKKKHLSFQVDKDKTPVWFRWKSPEDFHLYAIFCQKVKTSSLESIFIFIVVMFRSFRGSELKLARSFNPLFFQVSSLKM